MNHIAYSKRNYLAIKKRWLKDFILRRFFLRFLVNKNITKHKRFVVYPIIKDYKTLGNILNRLNWAFPVNDSNINVDIILSDNFDFNKNNIESIDIPKDQKKYLNSNNRFNFIFNKKYKIKNDSSILLYNSSYFFRSFIKFGFKNNIILDENYYLSIEGKNQRDLQFNFLSLSNKKNIFNKSIEIFNDINRYKKSYCFTTGPSFDQYKIKNFDNNSLKIICNSIIKNDEFLKYINGAHLLTFGDPVFHFGPSKYAAIFREKMVESVNRYKMKIVVPISTVTLLLNHYPSLKNSIIGVPDKLVNFSNPIFGKFSNKVNFNFPNNQNFWVKPSGNILSWYMIPFASSLSDEIYIIGADGRKKNENYWWKHSANVQFNSSMETVFNTHPSFFRDRIYADYYNSHCDYINKLFLYGEKLGKNYYSLTESYIPAIKKRVI